MAEEAVFSIEISCEKDDGEDLVEDVKSDIENGFYGVEDNRFGGFSIEGQTIFVEFVDKYSEYRKPKNFPCVMIYTSGYIYENLKSVEKTLDTMKMISKRLEGLGYDVNSYLGTQYA